MLAQAVLRGHICSFLDDKNVFEYDRIDAVANRLMELAKANHHQLVKLGSTG